MTREEIDRKVRTIFTDLFGVEASNISTDSSPDTVPGWDSLQHLNLITSIEGEFGVSLSDEQVVEMLSFGLIVEILSSALELS